MTNINITEELLIDLGNQQFMAQTSTCINCHQEVTRMESWKTLCMANPDPYDKGHVFTDWPFEPLWCGIPECDEIALGGGVDWMMVNHETRYVGPICRSRLLKLTTP